MRRQDQRMAFSSLLFLTAFFPAFVLLYWASPRKLQNGTLLALSILFYGWGAPRFLPVVLLLGVVDFALARAIATYRQKPIARWLVALAVTMHLSVLAYFKYANFFVAEVDDVLGKLGVHGRLGHLDVALPIGISFLTFEEISYVVDVYRGDARPSRSVPQYLLFLMLFPHSIAGPIFRYKDLERQLGERDERIDDVTVGITRFVHGLAKKLLVADAVALTADAAFSHDGGELTTSIAWLGATAYALQIFFDFSGYSDMAIGLGRIAGFRFKENFADPYSAASITEFWTRWHISLSSWLRDYLYIPLGGNRRGESRTRLHVLVVFVLSGLWHGASWTFVLWGLYHGLLTLFERTGVGKAWTARAPRWARVPTTFALVVVGWVFFRATTTAQAWTFLQAMAGFGASPVIAKMSRAELVPNRALVFLVVGGVFIVLRALEWPRRARRWRHLGLATAPGLLVLCLMQVINTKFVPLIYFKF
jgi:alginate O-acetyltransferase complex protein AlgI